MQNWRYKKNMIDLAMFKLANQLRSRISLISIFLAKKAYPRNDLRQDIALAQTDLACSIVPMVPI